MDQQLKPIFIFSQPRAGSTLLQRLISTHKDVKSVSEPWILLPIINSLKKQGTYSNYGHINMVKGVKEFLDTLPNQKDDFFKEIRNMMINLYTKSSGQETKYFLDKTPRYYLIIDEIFDIFPNGKFIFLWRNPLAVTSSMVKTWRNNNWCIFHHNIDLYNGPQMLTDAYKKYKKNSISIKYEDLIEAPHQTLSKILKYLEIPQDMSIITNFQNVSFTGSWGDKTGIKKFTSINNTSLDHWKEVMQSFPRKQWCKNYLNWIGKERLDLMGYDLADLLSEVNGITTNNRTIVLDYIFNTFGHLYCILEPKIIKDKCINLWNKKKILKHT